jgi:DNA-binding NarL/FixJ family response regulator
MSIRVAIVEDNRSVRENLAVLINAAPGFSCIARCTTAEGPGRACRKPHPTWS